MLSMGESFDLVRPADTLSGRCWPKAAVLGSSEEANWASPPPQKADVAVEAAIRLSSTLNGHLSEGDPDNLD